VGLQFAAFQAYNIFIRKIAVDTTKVAQAEERLLVAQNARAAAEQRGARVTAFFARSTERAAHATLAAANATTKWGKAWNSMKAFLMGNWIGLLLSALAMIGTYLYSSYKEAKRLNEELEKIGTEGALQADQSVRNFERLTKTIRESADGSEKQTKALAEMKRAYGDFLPSQDKSIINLVREKDGYNAVTQAIREKIALQIQEQKLNKVTSEYGGILGDYQGKVRENLEKNGWQRDIISAIFRTIDNEVKEGTLDISNVAQRLPEIFKQITGESLSYLQILTKSGSNFWGTPHLLEYIKNLNIYEDKLKDIISESEASAGI
jgi:vacuolar-type H+-ATPase subunit I/STV1